MSARHRNSGRGVPKPQSSSGSSEVCTTLGEKAHSLDTSGAAFGHWLRACDARVSSSSRSSAVKSPCAPNGSFGSSGGGREEAPGPLARRVLGAGRRATTGCRGPAPPPAAWRGDSSHACRRPYPKALNPACSLEAGGLDQPLARRSSSQPLGPRPRANGPITCQSVGAEG